MHLGLQHHLAGDDQQAEKELGKVLHLTEGYGDLRLEAIVRTRLGYVLEETGRLNAAEKLYARGHDLHNEMGQRYYAMNALAGCAPLTAQSPS